MTSNEPPIPFSDLALSRRLERAEGRRQGAQLSLLESRLRYAVEKSRLRYAVEKGCDIAMMCALPGSASQRNAERQGFRVAYTRIKWSQNRPSN